jgi:hypothetical protein
VDVGLKSLTGSTAKGDPWAIALYAALDGYWMNNLHSKKSSSFFERITREGSKQSSTTASSSGADDTGAVLADASEYAELRSWKMGGLFSIVFVRASLQRFFNCLSTSLSMSFSVSCPSDFRIVQLHYFFFFFLM